MVESLASIHFLKSLLHAISTEHTPTAVPVLKRNHYNENKNTWQHLFYLRPNNTVLWDGTSSIFQFLASKVADYEERLKPAFLSRCNSSSASNNRTDGLPQSSKRYAVTWWTVRAVLKCSLWSEEDDWTCLRLDVSDSDLSVLLIPSLPPGYSVQEVRSEHDGKKVIKNAALCLNWHWFCSF